MTNIPAKKEQMVKFLLAVYSAANRSISPAKLRKVSKEQLWEIISSNEQLVQSFCKYIEKDKERSNTAHSKAKHKRNTADETVVSAAELGQRLESLAAKLVASPTDFFAVRDFQEFVANLPHGVVPRETLTRVFDLIQTIDPPDIGLSFAMFMMDFMRADLVARDNG